MRGLTQEVLGERVEKTAESISNIERGQVLPPLDTLRRIAEHLDVPMAYFFEDIDKPSSVSRNRMELEQRLRGLSTDLTNEELLLALAVIEAIRAQRPQ